MGWGVGVGVGVDVGVGVGVLVGVTVGVGVGLNMTPLQPNEANPTSTKKPIRNRSLFLSNAIPPELEAIPYFCELPVPPLLHSHTINPTMRAAPPKEAKPPHRNM